MDTTHWIIVAVVIVIVLVVYSYRREIGIDFKGWGVKAKLRAKDHEEKAPTALSERAVRIGQDAEDIEIVTGDAAPGTRKPGAAGARSVDIGGSAKRSKIVTGDGNKIGR
jgi:hypothetical protein